MGIRLVMETISRAPASLTWRERYALVTLAASATDATRELPPGIENNEDIRHRLRLGRTERYAVLDSLCDKGALVRLERGRNGVKAVYAIAPFDITPGSEWPGEPDIPPVDNPSKGPGTPDASEGMKGPGFTTEGSGFNPSKGPGTPDASGPDTVFKGFRGFKTGGGTPLPPASRPLFPFALPDVPPEEGESLKGEKPAPDGPRALAAEIRAARPEWSLRSILRALEKPSVTERPWPLVRDAMRILADDERTQHPGRLEHDGPWWAEAARKVRDTGRPTGKPPQFAPRPEWCRDPCCSQVTRRREDPETGNDAGPCPKCSPALPGQEAS